MQLLLEQLTLVVVGEDLFTVLVTLAVVESSSFDTQLHSEQPYLQQVHRPLRLLEDLEFISLPHQVPLHSDTIYSKITKGPQGPFLINIPYKLGKIQCLHLHPDKTLLIIAFAHLDFQSWKLMWMMTS